MKRGALKDPGGRILMELLVTGTLRNMNSLV